MAKTKECPGIPKAGEAAHEAPLDQFAKNKAHKEGLSRLCRKHSAMVQAAYVARKRAAAGDETAGGKIVQLAAHISGKGSAKQAPEPEPELVGETPSATKARVALERKVDAANANGHTDEAQALLLQAAKQAEEGRRAAKRERDRLYQAKRREAAKAEKAGA